VTPLAKFWRVVRLHDLVLLYIAVLVTLLFLGFGLGW
jgi:hypothetical protein